MKVRSKALILMACALLLCVTSVTGTLAYMFDREEKVNTFTVGNVRISLTETSTKNPEETISTGTNEYSITEEIFNGDKTITKNPKVTLLAGSEECYIFIKLEETQVKLSDENQKYFLEYSVIQTGDNSWHYFDSYEKDGTKVSVYYCHAPAANADVEYPVLVGNKVTVNSDVTRDDLGYLTPEKAPTLTITAYAIQYTGVDFSQAWSLVGDDENIEYSPASTPTDPTGETNP